MSKMLILKNYNINRGNCEALAKALRADPRILTELFIDDCGLTDELLATILDGVSTQTVQYVSIKNSIVGVRAMEQINSLLGKTFPNQLLELTIVNCVLSAHCQRQLLAHLMTGFQSLTKLALVKV